MPSCMHRKPLKSLVYIKFRILPLRLRWLFKSLNRYLNPMNMWFIWWPGRTTTTLCVLLMTTAHWPGEAQKIVPRDLRFRHHIPEDFVQLDSENNQILPFPRAVVNYNLHMGEVDENAQQREHYSPVKHRCQRYWWSLFLFHLDAAILNAYILYKLSYPTSKTTRARFQKKMTTSLM